MVASLRPCNGILPGCGRHRAGRLRPADAASTRRFVVGLWGERSFSPQTPLYLFSVPGGRSMPTGGWGRPSGPPCPTLVGVGHAWRVWVHTRHRKALSRPSTVEPRHRPPGAASCLGGFRGCPPAGGRPAHPLRCGPVPILGNRPAPLHFFTISLLHIIIRERRAAVFPGKTAVLPVFRLVPPWCILVQWRSVRPGRSGRKCNGPAGAVNTHGAGSASLIGARERCPL